FYFILFVHAVTSALYTLSLHDALPIFAVEPNADMRRIAERELGKMEDFISVPATAEDTTLSEKSVDFVFAASAFHWFDPLAFRADRKSTRLNSSHVKISYAVFCLKKKK